MHFLFCLLIEEYDLPTADDVNSRPRETGDFANKAAPDKVFVIFLFDLGSNHNIAKATFPYFNRSSPQPPKKGLQRFLNFIPRT